jgi:hypothetical protein
MTIHEALQKIFTRLCEEHKKTGSNDWVDFAAIMQELGISRQVFSDVYQQKNRSDFFEFNPMFTMRLGVSGRESCDKGINPFKKVTPIRAKQNPK